MKKILMLLMFAPLFFTSRAQDSKLTFNPDRSLIINLGFGGSYNDYKNLNNRLDDANILTTGRFAFSNMLETDMRMKNFLIGLNGGMNLSARQNDNYKAWLAGAYAGLQFGYYVANSNKFHFGPQVGVGAYGSFIKITERNNKESFDGVLVNGNSSTFSQYTPMLDFALRFDFADFTKSKSCINGFRVGYRLGLSKNGYGSDGNSSALPNSPEDRLGQAYVMATIGLTALKPNNWKEMKKHMMH